MSQHPLGTPAHTLPHPNDRQAMLATTKQEAQQRAWLSRESGAQPATEHTRPTSGAASLTFSPSTTNMTGGPTLQWAGQGASEAAWWHT